MKKSKNHIICKVCEQKSALKIDPYDITTILYKAESSNPRFHNYESAYCENCGVIFMIDFPDQKKLIDFYNSDYRVSDYAIKLSNDRVIDLPIQIPFCGISYSRFKMFYNILKLSGLEEPTSNSYFIDYGGYQGFFLLAVRQSFGCAVVNYDYSQEGVNYAKNSFGIDGVVGKDISKDKFKFKADFISLVHVFEHLEDPVKFLKHIRQNVINSNGKLYIEIPNIYGDALVDPTHFYTFNELSISNTLKLGGFEIKKMITHSSPYTEAKGILKENISLIAIPSYKPAEIKEPLSFSDFSKDLKRKYRNDHVRYTIILFKKLTYTFYNFIKHLFGLVFEKLFHVNIRKLFGK